MNLKNRALAGSILSFCLGLATVNATPILVDVTSMSGDDIIANQLLFDDSTMFDLVSAFPPEPLVGDVRAGQFEALGAIFESPELFHRQMPFGASEQSTSSFVFSPGGRVTDGTDLRVDWRVRALSFAPLVVTGICGCCRTSCMPFSVTSDIKSRISALESVGMVSGSISDRPRLGRDGCSGSSSDQATRLARVV